MYQARRLLQYHVNDTENIIDLVHNFWDPRENLNMTKPNVKVGQIYLPLCGVTKQRCGLLSKFFDHFLLLTLLIYYYYYRELFGT